MGINLRSAIAVVNAPLELRGTMGTAENVPVGSQSIELVFKADSAADELKVQ